MSLYWAEVSKSSYLGGVDSYLGGVFSFGGCTHIRGCVLHFRATVLNAYCCASSDHSKFLDCENLIGNKPVSDSDPSLYVHTHTQV